MLAPSYLTLRETGEGAVVASTVDITNAGQTARIRVDIDGSGRILGIERLDGPVDAATLARVLLWAVSPTVPSAARRWQTPAEYPVTDGERDAAAAAATFILGHAPASNVPGGGWEWTDSAGATLNIGGRFGLAVDAEMLPSAAQWAEVSMVAELMAAQLAAAQNAGVVYVGAEATTIG